MGRKYSPPAMGEPFIIARNLGMSTPLGTAYTGVTLDIAAGEVCSVVAGNGEGKTELLLTLAGRMKPTSGRLEVAGLELPRKRARVRRRSGLGFFEHVNDVQKVLTVRSVVAAELNLYSRRSLPKYVRAYMQDWGLDGFAKAKIETLDRYNYVWLGIALGCVGDPALLVVDDIESELTRHQSIKLLEALRTLARERRMTVVVACTDYDLGRLADKAFPISKSAREQALAVERQAALEAARETVRQAVPPEALIGPAPAQPETEPVTNPQPEINASGSSAAVEEASPSTAGSETDGKGAEVNA